MANFATLGEEDSFWARTFSSHLEIIKVFRPAPVDAALNIRLTYWLNSLNCYHMYPTGFSHIIYHGSHYYYDADRRAYYLSNGERAVDDSAC